MLHLFLFLYVFLHHGASTQEMPPGQVSLVFNKLDVMAKEIEKGKDERDKLNSALQEVIRDNQQLKSANQQLQTMIQILTEENRKIDSGNLQLNVENEEFRSRIHQVEKVNAGTLADIDELKSENKRLKSHVHQLEAINQKISADIDELKSKDQQFMSHVHRLKISNQKVLTDVDELQSSDRQLKSMLHQQNQTVQYLSENVIEITTKFQVDPLHNIRRTIGFSVHPIHAYHVYEVGERILFPGVSYNSGSFSVENSEFTCPTTGLYYFNINIHFLMNGSPTYYGATELMMNESTVFHILGDSFVGDGHKDTVSNSIITECEVGQVVYLQAILTSQIYGSTEQYPYTTFNGLMLERY